MDHVTMCYVSQNLVNCEKNLKYDLKILQLMNDLQCHSRSLVMVPISRPHMTFYVFSSNYLVPK